MSSPSDFTVPRPWALLGERGAVLEGRLPLSLFERLVAGASEATREQVARGAYEVDARLGFSQAGAAASAWTQVDIRARLAVPLRCERCLEVFDQPLLIDATVAVVADEASAAVVPEAMEYVISSARMQPLELLEEELIMALPLVPAHPDPAACGEIAERLATLAPLDG